MLFRFFRLFPFDAFREVFWCCSLRIPPRHSLLYLVFLLMFFRSFLKLLPKHSTAPPLFILISFISLWSDKSIEVFNTFFALDENQSVITIIAPAKNKIRFGVSTFDESIPILSWSAGIPEIVHASYDCHAAIGTPMKLTRSFPANAKANAKVPTRIIIL